MFDNKVLVSVWLILLLLTLISVLMAEQVDFTALSVILVCAIVVVKSHLVIDYLIGLKLVHPSLRRVMMGYFYFIPSLIALGAICPEWIVSMTSLG